MNLGVADGVSQATKYFVLHALKGIPIADLIEIANVRIEDIKVPVTTKLRHWV